MLEIADDGHSPLPLSNPAVMTRNLLLTVALVVTGLAGSFFLALGSWAIHTDLHIPSPGILVWLKLVGPHEQPGSFGDMFAVQLSVDSVFWFVVICLVYLVARKLAQTFLGSR